MAWTDETKAEAIKAYLDGKPTPDNSTELIKQIAEDMEQSPNGVRMILVGANVYVKKGVEDAKTKATSGDGSKAPRVSKESSIADLKAAIEDKGVEVDDDILSKLTGKAAIYFLKVLQA